MNLGAKWVWGAVPQWRLRNQIQRQRLAEWEETRGCPRDRGRIPDLRIGGHAPSGPGAEERARGGSVRSNGSGLSD
jgi:hypothetical protein